jgi:hypothetical protein
MLANPQRDITAESAAARLRDLPEIHYRHQPASERIDSRKGNI